MPVQIEQVEDQVGGGDGLRLSLDLALSRQVHPPLEALEARPAVLSEGHDLAVQDGALRAEGASERPQLGVLRGDVGEPPAFDVHPPRLQVGDRANPVPLDLEAPLLLVPGELARPGEHRDDPLGHRLPAGIRRRVHAVDHPVLLRAGPEEGVLALEALPLEGEDHLVVAELLGVVGAGVPDLDRPRAVLALRDLALELEVLERVVLRPHRQAVLLRVVRDPVGDRPGRERAVALEAEVPVESAGAVLVDYEPRRGAALPAGAGLRRGALPPAVLGGRALSSAVLGGRRLAPALLPGLRARLRRAPEVPLLLVRAKPVGHCSVNGTRAAAANRSHRVHVQLRSASSANAETRVVA